MNASNIPETWDQDQDSHDSTFSSSLASLNVNAAPFIPNITPNVVPESSAEQVFYKQGESNKISLPSSAARGDDSPALIHSATDNMKKDDCEQTDEVSKLVDETDIEHGASSYISEDGELNNDVIKNQDNQTGEELLDGDNEENIEAIRPLRHTSEEVKKDHLNVVFIGHVDAGKSTIGGQIMYLTGMVDKRTLEKYEREAKEKNRETWYLSWVVDTNQEERDKGKTVEVGRAYFETDTKHFTILDAPGHRSFVPNMIGGASQADVAVLVISARRGEFETGFERGGQTREHAMLAKTAGVKHLVVLINKMDDPTVKWSLVRYEECKEKLTPFLKKIGFNPKTDIHFMPCSGLTGANLLTPDINHKEWYDGPPLIPYLDGLPSMKRSGDGPIRIPIVDKYKDMGMVVLGKLESGTLTKGMYLTMQPNKRKVKVLNILSDDVETEEAIAGENVKLRLDSIDDDEVSKGFVLCSSENLCSTGCLFDAQIAIIEYKSIICAGYSAILHIHTCIEEVEIKQLLCLIDRRSGSKHPKPKFVKQDQTVIARLQTSGAICIEDFKTFPQMGRFTLRDEGKTIAIGKVLKVLE